MKSRSLFTILIPVLAVLIVTGSCATTPKTQEERESANQEELFKTAILGPAAEVKRLIEAGVDVNARDNIEGHTALIYASGRGHTEIVKLLIEAGADVNARDDLERTALIYASQQGHIEVAKLLIEAGAK